MSKEPRKQQSSGKPSGRVRLERSAGVVLFRPDSTAPGGRVFLLLDYGRHWDYPKGHVEKGEDDRTAAARELAEETGITEAQFLPDFRKEIVYYFRKPQKGLVRKTVMFFLASTSCQTVQISHEHVGYVWLPADQALRRLTYPTARKVFRAAIESLNSNSGTTSIPPRA